VFCLRISIIYHTTEQFSNVSVFQVPNIAHQPDQPMSMSSKLRRRRMDLPSLSVTGPATATIRLIYDM